MLKLASKLIRRQYNLKLVNIINNNIPFACAQTKGVGPGMTLAWPGWKQSDIAVEVDTGQLETSRFKKCCTNCVLL